MKIQGSLKKTMLLLLFAIIVSSCMEKKYQWSVEISAPKEYPIVIHRGLIGKSFFGASCVSSSWGIGIEVAKKQDFAVPETFEITWLSLVEKKFYKGKWKLPKNKIEEFLKKNTYPTDKKANSNVLQIGLAPKGVAIMWILNNKGVQIEIGRYQAEQITLESKDVYDNAKFMFEKDFINKALHDPKIFGANLKKNIAQFGYPPITIFDVYREKYPWSPKIMLPEGFSVSQLDIKMCNGEKETIQSTLSFNKDKRALPYFFQIEWKDKNGQKFVSKIAFTKSKEYRHFGKEELPLNFDKNQILTLFKEKTEKSIPSKIVIKIENELVSDFYLEQEDKRYQINEFSQATKKAIKNNPCICK